MSSQDQDIENGSVGIQSGRDTIIQQGITTEQLSQILGAIAALIPSFVAIAKEIVDARLEAFEKEIMSKFANSQKADSEAFKDPDFLYMLASAQHAYVRSDDQTTQQILIDLLARRSQEKQRSRLSLTLNQAIEKASFLTINEFAELSLCFLVSHTYIDHINSLELFAAHINEFYIPLLDKGLS